MRVASAPQLPIFEEPTNSWTVLDERRRGTAFIEVPISSAINPPSATGMGFWSLNPYFGCEFGCSYCYARDAHRYRMERGGADPEVRQQVPSDPDEAFERRILVKRNLVDRLAQSLEPGKLAGQPLVIGTSTDPYQPAERSYRLTRRVLEALCRFRGLTIGITTKSPLVTRDLDLFLRLSELHDLSISLSLTTTDSRLIRRLEARSPMPAVRLGALERLTRAGIHAGVLLAPIIPGITDDLAGMDEVFKAAQAAGAGFVFGIVLRLDRVTRRRFLPHLEREFPHLSQRYRQRYGAGSYAPRAYRDAVHGRVRRLQWHYGMPVQAESRRNRRDRLEVSARDEGLALQTELFGGNRP